MEEENRKILEFSRQQQAREEERMASKKEQEEAMAALQRKLAEEIFSKKAQAEEMERSVFFLYTPSAAQYTLVFYQYSSCIFLVQLGIL